MPGRAEKAERKLIDTLKDSPAEEATVVLRDRLVANPRDVAAMRLLARLERLAGDTVTSWRLLERALDLCPGYIGAREDYAASLLERRSKAVAAARETKLLLDHAPRNANYRRMHAYAMIFTGKLDIAIGLLDELLRENPLEPQYWQAYAQALHFLGRRHESEQAFRKCLELKPDMGEAYFGLAELKAKAVTQADVAAMHALLDKDALDTDSRMPSALRPGADFGTRGRFCRQFRAYEEGARLFRTLGKDGRKGHDRNHAAIACGARRRCSVPKSRDTDWGSRANWRRHHADLHRRHAPGRIDPGGTDPRQPQPGGRHPRTAA